MNFKCRDDFFLTCSIGNSYAIIKDSPYLNNNIFYSWAW